MLIRFSVENFLSYNGRQTLDMSAVKTCKDFDKDNTFEVNGTKLLNSAVIYGANASGKSNLFKAIRFLQNLIVKSAETSSAKRINVSPFYYTNETRKRPTTFEVEFICKKTQYRYGFAATGQEIVSEWLFEKNQKGREAPLFYRFDEGIQVFDKMKEASNCIPKTKNNSLFLSVCDQWNITIAKQIILFFNDELKIASGLSNDEYQKVTIKLFQDYSFAHKVKEFIRNADLNIVDISAKFLNFDDEDSSSDSDTNSHELYTNLTNLAQKLAAITGKDFEIEDITSTHNIYDSNNNIINKESVNFMEFESAGTQKAFALAGPLLNVLLNGGMLFIDELDSQMHPTFTRKIVQMFNSKEQNPNHAQLIFATHDANLLDNKMLRRDQIWFTEKNHGEATELYSLIDFIDENNRKVRKDATYSKDYLSGRYGAIPFLGNLKVFGDNHE